MLSPDQIFSKIKGHFPAAKQHYAAIRFRRIAREYLVYRAGRSFAPGMKSSTKIVVNCKVVYTGGRSRRVYTYLKPSWKGSGRGRPPNLPAEMLVSRLAHLWASACGSRTTISFKSSYPSPTPYEDFMGDALIYLGVMNHRKYLEIHSRRRPR